MSALLFAVAMKLALAIPARKQHEDAPPSGWCGETAIQEGLLHLGVWASHADRPWQSMVFASLALGQLWVALALRTGTHRLTGNPWLTAAVAASRPAPLAPMARASSSIFCATDTSLRAAASSAPVRSWARSESVTGLRPAYDGYCDLSACT